MKEEVKETAKEERPHGEASDQDTFQPAFVARERDGRLVDATVEGIDAEGLFEDVRNLVRSSGEAKALAVRIERGLRIRQEGSTRVLELDEDAFEALKELSRQLPRGVFLKPEALLAKIHRQDRATGFHLVLGRLILPDILEEFYRKLPETIQADGIRYTITGLHKRLEEFARENEAILLRMIKKLSSLYAPSDFSQGAKA